MASKPEKKEATQLDTFDLIKIWRASKTPTQFEKDCVKLQKKKAKEAKKYLHHTILSGKEKSCTLTNGKERFGTDSKKKKKEKKGD